MMTVDEERKRTLETLIDLARGFDAVGCWDPERASELLRNESSPEELESLGVERELILNIWPGATESEPSPE